MIQQYVDRPLLLAGRKFDVRAYCLIARTTPHLWYFHPGYCKVALEPYAGADAGNRFAHLTNACVQKTHPDYKQRRGQHIWSLAEAEADLVERGHPGVEAGAFWAKVHEEMKRSLGAIYDAAGQHLARRSGYFDLLGLDFLLDEDLNVLLLEVNSNPAMWLDSSATLAELVPRLLGTTLDTVLAAQNPDGVPPAPPAPFELVVDEAAGFRYS